MKRVLGALLLATTIAPWSSAAQEAVQYEEQSRGLVTVNTPNGPVEIRSEHDATISIERLASDTLRAWYDALEIASIAPAGETRPATDEVLGEWFLLHESEDGRLRALQTPDFPESFQTVSDLTQQFFDFFPTRPDDGYRLGAEWSDTTQAPPSAAPDTEVRAQKVTHYRIEEEAVHNGVDVFVIRAEATLDIQTNGPLPDQPGLRIATVMSGSETNTFWVAKDDGRLVERVRTGELSGRLEYVGTPQPVILPTTRTYENSIVLIGSQ